MIGAIHECFIQDVFFNFNDVINHCKRNMNEIDGNIQAGAGDTNFFAFCKKIFPFKLSVQFYSRKYDYKLRLQIMCVTGLHRMSQPNFLISDTFTDPLKSG